MNDTPALPPPPEEPPTAAPPAGSRFGLESLLYLAGFIVLAVAIVWLWRNPPAAPARPAADPAEVAALRQQVQGLEQRLARLEQRPVPAASPAPDLKPLEARIAALEQRPVVPADIATRTDLTGIANRLDALAGRQDQLASREQGLETGLGNRMDAVETKIATLEKDVAATQSLAARVDADTKRLDTVERQAGQIAALADKAGRIARVQAAQAALDTGQPLGDLPGAPASLARFAQERPPTEAELKLSFPAAAQAAEAASRPSTEGKPFLDRMWLRAQDLVNLREGDTVILGDPASGVIARARRALDAGDLAGAVAALNALAGPPAQAMAAWKARAQALLDARAALAAMAARVT